MLIFVVFYFSYVWALEGGEGWRCKGEKEERTSGRGGSGSHV